MQGGWIKIHRSLMSWEWWDDAVMVKAFLSILMMCGSDETRWHGQTLPAGSFVTSRAKLAGVLGLTEKQTRTVLSRLTETGEITTRTNNHCTIVIVNNWADYQLQKTDKNGQPEQFDFQRISADFQIKRADQGPTKGRQKADQGPTEGHKQEEKNIPPLLSKESIPPQGETEKPKRKVFVKPTVEEIAAYCRDRGNNIDLLCVTARSGVRMTELEPRMRQILARQHQFDPKDKQALFIMNTEQIFSLIDNLFRGVNFLILLVGLGTILAGVIGVSNIMMVTVKERTTEIGIRRAIGATPRDILSQIIMESITLTLVAGSFGIVFAVQLLRLLQMIVRSSGENPDVTFQIGFWLAIVAALLLTVLGVVAGLAPASRAMAIKPVDAMRDE